ncbi:SpoIIE family protein phosphatase [candidate division KSB1 bacterium]|nr:SpoIIE family protein phosphatase [candidate division KSB1 bacterium]
MGRTNERSKIQTGEYLMPDSSPKERELLAEIDRLKMRVENLSSLIQVGTLVNSSLDLNEVLNLVMEKAQSVMHSEASSVMLVNHQVNMLECKVALGQVGHEVQKTIHLKKGQGIAGWVWEHKKALIVPDVTKDERFFSQIDEKSGFKTKSILTVPLLVKDKIIGVAQVINRNDGQEFDQQDLELFQTFASQVAMAIETARMHAIALEQERLEQQLEVARTVQQSFMPTHFPVMAGEKFQLAAKTIQAAAVGGDFYDAFALDEDHLGLLIGDVSGKGIPAALLMARLMSDIRALVREFRDPRGLMTAMNTSLAEKSQQGLFVTLFYVVVNIKSGQVQYSNGGHIPMLHTRGSATRFLHGQKGTPLGIFEHADFETRTFTLSPGDKLLLLTDGIHEARNVQGEFYGLDRVKTSMTRPWESAEQWLDDLIEIVNTFASGRIQHDDMTALVFRWNA